MARYGVGGYASTLVNPAGGGAGYGWGGGGLDAATLRRNRIGGGGGGVPAGGEIIPGNVGLPQMPYQPGAPAAAGVASTLETTGRGLLDPGSDYSRRMMDELRGQIGGQTQAQKRLAALEASRSGYGGGESAELMASLGDIDVAGTEAMGEGIGDLLLRSPELALRFLTPAMMARLGISEQDLEAWRTQQGIQQRGQELGLEALLGRERIGLEREQLGNEAMYRQLALMFGSL